MPKQTWLGVKDGVEGAAEAASLGLALLRKTKQNTWAELAAAMDAADPQVVRAFTTVSLTGRQLGLLDGEQLILQALRVSPAAIPAICPVCGYWVLADSAAPPSSCLVTRGCSGKPAKVVAATARDTAPDDSVDAPVDEPAAAEQDLDAQPEADGYAEVLEPWDNELPGPDPADFEDFDDADFTAVPTRPAPSPAVDEDPFA
ncbi:hypothetical protein V6N00_12890 [Tersicoccus sp. MR15.9]|uniref:hypothetical protein n=1 Tax=Tersicoccus mangrovi TaxID=3121635 RepID=UPI002FE5963F